MQLEKLTKQQVLKGTNETVSISNTELSKV